MAGRQVNTLLDEDIVDRLDALARRTGRTKSFYVRQSVLAHLEDLEDAYLSDQAEAEFRRSGDDAVPLEAVEWPS